MAKMAPPGNKKTSSEQDATSKPDSAAMKPLQFKVPLKLHQEIKLYAVEQGLSMTELFLEMYQEYRESHS